MFSKGLVQVQKVEKLTLFQRFFHGFGANMAIFPTFFLGNIGWDNILYDMIQRKNAFLGFKNKKFKKSKN